MGRVKMMCEIVRLSVFVLIGYTKGFVLRLVEHEMQEDDCREAMTGRNAGIRGLAFSCKAETQEPFIYLLHRASPGLVVAFYREAVMADRVAEGECDMIAVGKGARRHEMPKRKRPCFWAFAGRIPGEVILAHRIIENATAYIWEYNLSGHSEGEAEWRFAGASVQSRFIVRGGESGRCIGFRCCGVTRRGVTSWSEVICITVP